MNISKYHDLYLHEAAEHLQRSNELLIALEEDPENHERISALFREVHSIKGMAATMGHQLTARLAHHLEDGLDLCRERGAITSHEIDRLLAGFDLLEGLVDDTRHNRPERAIDDFITAKDIPLPILDLGESKPPPEPCRPENILRIRVRLADSVTTIAPRLLVLLKRLADYGKLLESTPSEAEILQGTATRELLVCLETSYPLEEIRELLSNYSELETIEFPHDAPAPKPESRATSPAKTVRVSTDLLDHFINLTGELITNRYALQEGAHNRNWQKLDEGLGKLTRLVKNLHHQVLQVRMMPLGTVTGRLPRAVRDLSRTSGKNIELMVEGADIELDRAILEELSDPLLHMIRNAIDHGIEKRGKICIKAWRERDQVLIQVADDGRGIDPELLRQRAMQRGLLSQGQAETIRTYDLLQLICQPGLSTATDLSETSGRGVGMDVVKTAVEHLGGVLLIDSAPGEGTRITMKLPLSVAIIRVLMIECDQLLMALPITRVLQTLEVAPRDFQSSGKQPALPLNGELLPLHSLRTLLNRPTCSPRNPVPIVISEVFGRKIGLMVDRLAGQREVFVQTLPAPFDGLRGCSSGTILGDGRIMFLLDLPSLMDRRRG